MTVDRDLIDAGNRAVAEGRADSLSGWVNAALFDRAARDRRLEALASAIAGYEVEYGEITDEEMAAVERADRQAAVVVRGRRRRSASPSSSPGKGAA